MVTNAQIKPIRPYGTIRVLAVGISDYQDDRISDLQFAHRDAEAFAHFMQNETDWAVKEENIVLLTNEQATYARFINELDKLTKSSRPQDRLYIYFSGHGDVETRTDDKNGYLLFYDVSATTYASGGACMVQTLDQHLSKLVLEKKTDVILISDACRSGSLAGSSTGGPEATTAALSELFNKTIKILSCEPNQVSVEGEQWGNGRGLFSYYLINGLKGLADEDQNLFVDLYELEQYVKREVRRASNKRQLPVAKGLSSARIIRVNPQIAQDLRANPPTPSGIAMETTDARSDTSFLESFQAFEKAIAQKHLLYPEEGSAYRIYENMGDHPKAESFKKIMKISLASALQDEAQQALNEYITSTGKELARRWKDAEIYSYYPEYLNKAAQLLGVDNYFYPDVKSRAAYFEGVNLRLNADNDHPQADSLYQVALIQQQEALRLQPIGPHIHNEMGLLYRRLDQPQQELMAFQKAHALSPKWTLATTNLAFTHRALEQYDISEQLLVNAIAFDPEFSLAHYHLANIFEDQNNTAEAIKHYRNAITCPNPVPDAFYMLGLNYSFSGDQQQAAAYAEQYIETTPNDPDGYGLLAYILKKAQKFQDAKEALLRGLQQDPSSSYNMDELYNLSVQQNDFFEETAAALRDFIVDKPDDSNAYFRLASTYLRNNDSRQAIRTIEQLLANGFRNYDNLITDEGLNPLLQNKRYEALLKTYFPEKY